MRLLTIFKKYIAVKKLKILIFFIIGLVQALTNIFLMYKLGDFIDVINQSKNLVQFKRYIIMFLFLNSFTIILNYVKNYLYVRLQMHSSYSFIADILCHLQKIPILRLKEFDVRKTVQLINTDVNGLISFQLDFIDNFLVNFMMMIISILVLFNMSKSFMLILLLASVFYLVCCTKMKEILLKVNMDFLESKTNFFSVSLLQLENVKSSKIHAVFNKLNEVLEDSFKKVSKCAINQFKYSNIYNAIGKVIRIFIQISIFLIGGFLVIDGKLTLGYFTIVNSFFTNILNSIDYFYNLFSEYQNTKVMLNRIKSLTNIKIEKDSVVKIKNINNVTLKNMTFGYDKNNIIFDNLNQEFFKNKVYLIKGKNGCGKTTLVNCIIGIFKYDYKGDILFDGINIHEIDMDYMRRTKISMVEQRPTSSSFYYFSQGIEIDEKNISIIQHFDLLKKFKIEGNKYYLKNQDIDSLSGGEKQKLAILAGISKKSEVIIFDEPTSNLDQASKLFFLQLINDIKSDRIVIIISHEDIYNSVSDIIIDNY